MKHPLLASLVFGQAHMIEPAKLDIILRVLADRMDLSLEAPTMPDPGSVAAMSKGPVAALQASASSSWGDAGGGVSILSVAGTLVHRASGLDAMSGLTSYASLSAQFDAMLNSSQVSHIVLDLNSPGGSVNGAFDFADEIYNARGTKPITAIVDESAYSAAYVIASAADEIVLPRTGGVGSIGVVAAHMDRSAANERDGIKVTYVYAGARKADGNPHEPLSAEAQSGLQAEVDRVYELFVETVARNRGLSVDAVRATEAAVYRGPGAVDAKLADRISPAKDALRDVLGLYQSPGGGSGRFQRAATAMRIKAM
ncbi:MULTISPECIES: S49 family peptidase [unclassified Herbaspirillum]|uniref:S49 family peptidase n=1 Tax=unclassified Herbaspirillum TaxID=2624150 RepID=UPI000E2E5163|nr:MULTISPECIES: S49 family peptidase [unclassified Herbaspirillum]RFB73829.1 S49 family peptidase [Herbaspirillum sp. 3R-3a1]TFI10360.1 S49 family peptidase [Herbaspirillum sp. 3R11]TFI16264.1 S49 family peptidase [Herbaspirillum sp. 3R-11]TFI28361.1 S49 family peptidase [Herbaspirillum sp. 3C11]